MKKLFAMPGYFDELKDGADGGSPDGGEAEAETPQDAVLEELGIADAVAEGEKQSESATGQETKQETKPAEQQPEEKQPEEKKADGLTEADLAPLDSKSQNANERFRKVTEGYKQEKQRADEASAEAQRYRESFESLKQLGYNDAAAAEDLVEFSAFRKALQEGDEQAVRMAISNTIKMFEAAHGKRITIQASVLDDFPDLQRQVDGLEITEQAALELARSRRIQERASRESQQLRREQEFSAAHQQAIQQSVESVKQMQANWEQTDPDFKALLPHLQAQMEDVARNFPPDQWPRVIEMQYRSLKAALAGQAQRSAAPAPLRGTGHTVGRPAPSNPTEAVLQELGLMD
jgi:hypothetical protein